MKTKYYLIPLLMALHQTAALAQSPALPSPDTTFAQPTRSWQLDLNLTQLIVGEMRLNLHHTITKRWDAGLSFGYRFKRPTPFDRYGSNDALSGEHLLFLERKAHGPMMSLDLKYRFGAKQRTFWQSDIFYRYWILADGFLLENWIAGFKSVIGQEWLLSRKPTQKVQLGLAGFIGAGIRMHKSKQSFYHSSASRDENRILPSVQLGASIFFRKNNMRQIVRDSD